MQRGPMRNIVTSSAIVGVLTAGVVLVVSAPSPDAGIARGEAEGRWQAARYRLDRELGSGDWELIAAQAAQIADEYPEREFAWLRLAQARERLGLSYPADIAWRRLDELTRAVDDDSHPRWISLYYRGWALDALGRRGEARAAWVEAADQIERNSAWRLGAYWHARVYALAGWRGKALDALETAVESEPHHLARVVHEPDLEPLRDDPRFVAVVERIRVAREQRRREREQPSAEPPMIPGAP